MPFPDRINKKHYTEGMIEFGRITTVDPVKCRATVTFPDRNYQSNPLSWAVTSSLGHQDYNNPTVGDTAIVLHNGSSRERGVIIGTIYTNGNPPPAFGAAQPSGTIRGILLADGSFVIYDTAGGGNYQINLKGKATLTTVGDVNATIGGALTAAVSGLAKITAPNIELHGAVKVFGTLECTDVFTADIGGRTLAGHITNADGQGGGS